MINHEHWLEAQEEEKQWWGDCANTFWEEHKQLVYAALMGLEFFEDGHSPFNIDLAGLDVLDVGGGPVSLLLKAKNLGAMCRVVDPCVYPDWVYQRYHEHGLAVWREAAENLTSMIQFDEVWMYNCLQHTVDPAAIVSGALEAVRPGGVFRIFEWIDTPTNVAHPHSLSKEFLDSVIGQSGETTTLSSDGCFGKSYFGAFTKSRGDNKGR